MERRVNSRYYRDGAVTGDFNSLMTTLAEALGAPITEAQIRAHAQMFGDVPLAELRLMFERAARDIQFGGKYPTPGTLRSFLRPPAEEAALIVWAGLCRAAELIGAWQNLYVDDPAAADSLLSVFGSWPAFCEIPEGPQLALKRQEFLAAYRTARRFGMQEMSEPVRLEGLLGPIDAEVAEHCWVGRLSLFGTVEKLRAVAALPPAPDRKQVDGAREPETGTA